MSLKKVIKTKKMTIDDLAMLMAKHFGKLSKEIRFIKTDLERVKTDLNGVKTDLGQVKTDLQSFKEETRENFEKVNEKLDENKESNEAVIADYHPRIIKLEKKVFGVSTLE